MPKVPRSEQRTLLFTIVVLFLSRALWPSFAQAPTTYYVATDGNDSGSGTLSSPFKTIQHAKDVVRARIATGMSADVTVLIRGGEYFQESQVNFQPADSGRNGFKVIYKNYPGEKPIINHGRRLTGWQLDAGNIYKVPVSWTFHTLYENGVRSEKARYPNTTSTNPYVYSRVNAMISGSEKTKFGFRAGDIPQVAAPTSLEVVIWAGGTTGEQNWFRDEFTVGAIDYSARVVSLGQDLTVPGTSQARYELGVGSRYYVQGAKELLDQAGEFWIGNGNLYYWPRTTPIENQIIIAPSPGSGPLLYAFNGTSASDPVHDIQFEGLTLGYTDRYAEAIYVQYGQRLTFKGNHIFNTGGDAIQMSRASTNNTIEGNLIHDVGQDGIFVSGFDSADTLANPRQNVVSNNYVHYTGQIVGHSNGIHLGKASGTTISHNLIHNTPRASIGVFGELSAPNTAPLPLTSNNTIEYNDASRANTDSQDSGVIYIWASGPGNVIRNNRVHDSDMAFSFGQGIYLDDDNNQTTVSGNVVHDLQQNTGGITFAGIEIKGIAPRILNNIVANNRISSGELRVNKTFGQLATQGAEISRNILYRNNTSNFYHFPQYDQSQIRISDKNLFMHDGGVYNAGYGYTASYSTTGTPNTFESLNQWRVGHGHDENSVVADPLFIDPDNRDYRLRPDSPAYALGFEDIDFGSMGLTADFPYADPDEELTRLFVTSSRSGVGATIRFYPGDTTQLSVTGRTRTGYIANLSNATVTFSSSSAGIATVDAQGLVTARSNGTATITIAATKSGIRKTTVIYAIVTSSTQTSLIAQPAGAASTATIGPANTFRAGYATLSLTTGPAPYGTAVFSYRQNDIVVSEVGVPASPATTASRIFVDVRTNVGVNTGFAVVNRGSATATMNLTLRDLTGSTVQSGSIKLGANSHLARFMTELAPDFVLPSGFSFGSLDILSDQPVSILALRLTGNQRGDVLLTSSPVADLTQARATGAQFFPQIADGGGYQTTLLLMNTSNTTETGSVSFFNNAGAQLSQFPYSIPAGGALRSVTDGSANQVSVGWAQVVPSGVSAAPVGAGIFSLTQAGNLITESGVPSALQTTQALIYIDKSGNHDTGLAIANPGASSLHLTLSALQLDGRSAGAALGTLELAAKAHDARFIGQLIPSGLPDGFRGVLVIQSDNPFVALTLRSLVNGRGDFLLTTFPTADATRPAPSPVVFPQIADGGGYQTEFILLNAGGSASNSTVSFFGDDGLPISVGR